MTDKKQVSKETSGERKTLRLKSSTLGLKTNAHSSDVEAKVNKYASKGSSRGPVVVVTKGKSSNGDTSFSKDSNLSIERERKLALLRQAEKAKQAELERRNAIIKAQEQKKQELEEERLAELKKKEEQEVLSKTEESEEDRIHSPATSNEKPSSNFVLQKNRIRNLDKLAKKEDGPEKDFTKEEEVLEQTKDKSKFKKSVEHIEDEVKEVEQTIPNKKTGVEKRSSKRISVTQVMMMDGDDEEITGRRGRSFASIRRAKDKARRKQMSATQEKEKIFREVLIPDVISVQELANRMSEKSADVIKALMKMGMMVTVNQSIDADTAEIVVGEFGHNFKRITNEEIEKSLINDKEDTASDLLPRAPVVTIMGHVDHGKTSLLDALRSTDVAAGEAGGITQHIGAYQIKLSSGKYITFLDTPGHEAFTAMRLRGAEATDIVVLVIAADDGIKEQTIEAINHAKAAQVPIIVAINKIDKPQANVENAKMELLQHNLIPEDMGGDIMVVAVSAKQRTNLDKLEEVILLQAEMLELKANPHRLASGVVIESKIDKGRGPVATLLVQKGTLRVGDSIVVGSAYGNVRALINDKGHNIDEALPSMPIEVLGISTVPTAGDSFLVATNEKAAKDIAQHRINLEKEYKQVNSRRTSLEQLFMKTGKGGIKELPVVVKADVQGSVEAICNSLEKLATEEVKVNVLHAAAGGITESDVTLARASEAVILGFNVRANNQARDAAKTNGVDIRYYSVIYSLVDDIKLAMGGMLSPVIKEEYLGTAEVRQVFNLSKYGKVAGCYVTDGLAKRGCKGRLVRDDVVIYEGKIKALKRFKEDLKEVKSGFECGVSFENYEDIKASDKIEFYETIEEARKL